RIEHLRAAPHGPGPSGSAPSGSADGGRAIRRLPVRVSPAGVGAGRGILLAALLGLGLLPLLWVSSRGTRSFDTRTTASVSVGLPHPGEGNREWIERLDHPYTAYLRAFPAVRVAGAYPPPPVYEEWRATEGDRVYRDLHRPLPRTLQQLVERHR